MIGVILNIMLLLLMVPLVVLCAAFGLLAIVWLYQLIREELHRGR